MTWLADAPSLAWERLLEAGEVDERLVMTSVEPAHGSDPVAPPRGLAPELSASLRRAGIEQLYSHQAEALAASSCRRCGDFWLAGSRRRAA